jgi:hypothetical protein
MAGASERNAHDVARDLLEEMRPEYDRPVSERLTQRPVRPFFWSVALAAAIGLGAFEIALTVLSETDSVRPPPARLLAQYRFDPCAQRQAMIMRAIEAYRSTHGAPPVNLATLRSPELSESPVDPVSGKPYQYLRRGDYVTLICPNPELHDVHK